MWSEKICNKIKGEKIHFQVSFNKQSFYTIFSELVDLQVWYKLVRRCAGFLRVQKWSIIIICHINLCADLQSYTSFM